MNRLPRDKQIQIITALVEGCSIRSIERMYDVHRDTITRLLMRTGDHCMTLMEDTIQDIPAGTYQCDEIWCFVGKKDARLTEDERRDPEIGSQFIFVAMDTETKLVPCFRIGKRLSIIAHGLMADLRQRVIGRPTIITDGFEAYQMAVQRAFGYRVDFAQLIKTVHQTAGPVREGYAPAVVVRSERRPMCGHVSADKISTSLIERQNLTMRMSMGRLTRLTNAFSKKRKNLMAATALHFAHYNLCRVHKTLRMTPAMAASVADTIWEIEALLPN